MLCGHMTARQRPSGMQPYGTPLKAARQCSIWRESSAECLGFSNAQFGVDHNSDLLRTVSRARPTTATAKARSYMPAQLPSALQSTVSHARNTPKLPARQARYDPNALLHPAPRPHAGRHSQLKADSYEPKSANATGATSTTNHDKQKHIPSKQH